MSRKWEPFKQGTHQSIAPDPALRDKLEKKSASDTQIFRNNLYTVHRRTVPLRDTTGAQVGTIIHLSIHDHPRSTRRDWRHFQKIKNELIGPEEEAFELYPAESRLVDISNEWHLWCIKGVRLPVGYGERWVSESTQADALLGAGRQRKWDDEDRPADLRDVAKQDIVDYCKEGE